ncbi:flagellin N-terminal helical domain-containing protein [Alicyclobacillus acidiphilus]|uniref:flagellin N-terminal helical domain-containing protein n=1 Tax=Alicyclobacillus acidiphilus TaxID=182455 RepID=UPI00082A0512|nr:flagellin [Alicyclobacillus acidiphilus]
MSGLIIGHNLGAMSALSALNANSNALNSALQQLSTGKKINSAADDASGYAISQKMQAQISGLNQASQNAQDGISMIQTASGALDQTTSILQQMRQLAVQASNSTTTQSDRQDLQTEFNQLADQINNIANTTQYNTKNLLDGSLSGQDASGTTNATVFSSALGAPTSASIPGATLATGAFSALASGTNTISVDGANISFNVNASDYQAFDNGTTVNVDGVANQLQKDINSGIDQYNQANGTSISHVSVTNNGGKIEITSGTTGDTSTLSFTADTAGNDMWNAIKGTTGGTTPTDYSSTGSEGVLNVVGAAELNTLTTSSQLTATIDGHAINVKLTATGAGGYTSGTTDMSTVATHLQTDLNNAIDSYNQNVPSAEQVAHVSVAVKDGELEVTSGTSGQSGSVSFDDSSASQLLGLANQSSSGQSGGLTFQIGANSGQTMTLNIGNMSAQALGITGTAGATGYSATNNVNNGIDNDNTQAALDITSTSNADSAINTIDTAIQTVTTEQANLGAVQNRLTSTISNLSSTSQNLTTADSGITDTDMASEMAAYTQDSVLQQAAVSMLAQANQQPQLVLKLLS